MKTIRLDVPFNPNPDGRNAEVVLDEGQVKVRRIDLAAGARIPPCEMREDVVFVVLSGRVSFSTESSTAAVDAPGAVYIPGRGVTRSLTAESPFRVLAVLCRGGNVPEPAE
jgi:quercetin dioxygenase-like cupin family protein